jgi:hypothetical protein
VKPAAWSELAVQFATLNDGTTCTGQTTLDAKAKEIQVVIQNIGYRPMPISRRPVRYSAGCDVSSD